ncbi:MAG TPA: SRPBCC domain-containing protein, partial [Actinomycetota bacterium]|nr:SRPBCC domain-containing protein [Actinomycetota bacterium]
RIAAPIEVVWAHLTTAEGLVRWVGPAATADPAPGGALHWTHPDGSTVVGRFVEVDPPRRVVFTYGWEDGRMGVPPGSTTVEIDLVEEDGATTVRLVHHGLPPRDRRGPPGGMGLLPRRPRRHPRGPVRWRPGVVPARVVDS